MRIGIDARYLSHGLVGGVHAYIAHMVPALIELARDHQIVLYADTKRPFELSRLPGYVAVRLLPWRSPLSSVAHDLLLWRRMAADALDVAHFPANYGFGPPGARTVITLHDAINVMPWREIMRGHAKQARTLAMMTYLHLCSRAALRRADVVLTVSEHARREIQRYSGFDRSRIIPVPHAPSSDLRRIDEACALEEVRRRHGLGRAFVLADALKNPAALVRAWRRLAPALRGSFQIVFFSRRDDVLPIVREAVASGDATLLIRPSRPDLIALYSMASAFVFPSWIEGFGIPLLEAMACGAPVIASDRGAIPEVLGDAGLLADAEDDALFARHLTLVLGQPEIAEQLRLRGYERVRGYTWQRSAQSVLESYRASALPAV